MSLTFPDTIEFWLIPPVSVDADQNPIVGLSLKVTWPLNDKFEWTMVVPGKYTASTWADFDEWVLHVKSVNGNFTPFASFPLVCWSAVPVEGTQKAPQTTLMGQDLQTYLLGGIGRTGLTQHDRTLAQVFAYIANQAVMVGGRFNQNSSNPNLWTYIGGGSQGTVTITLDSSVNTCDIYLMDMQGVSWGEHMTHLAKGMACNWRVQTDGSIFIFRNDVDNSMTNSIPLAALDSSRPQNKSAFVTELHIKKVTPLIERIIVESDKSGTFPGDLTGGGSGPGLRVGTIHETDLSTSGHVAFIIFYDGVNQTGSVCETLVLDYNNTPPLPPVTSTNPAKSFEWSVVPPSLPATTVAAKLAITGQPYDASHTYDGPFEVVWPDTNLTINANGTLQGGSGYSPPAPAAGVREHKATITSSFWDVQALIWTSGGGPVLAPLLYWEANKVADQMHREMVYLDPHVLPGGVWNPGDGWPSARYDKIEYEISGNTVKQTMDGYVWPF